MINKYVKGSVGQISTVLGPSYMLLSELSPEMELLRDLINNLTVTLEMHQLGQSSFFGNVENLI